MRVEPTLGNRIKGSVCGFIRQVEYEKKLVCELQIRSWHLRTFILSCDILDVIPLGFGLWNPLLSVSLSGSLVAFPATGRFGILLISSSLLVQCLCRFEGMIL